MGKTDLIKELCALPNNSLLVISKTGLKRIYCPFKVRCIDPIGIHLPQDIITVEAIKLSRMLKLGYKIEDQVYYHHHFEIIG